MRCLPHVLHARKSRRDHFSYADRGATKSFGWHVLPIRRQLLDRQAPPACHPLQDCVLQIRCSTPFATKIVTRLHPCLSAQGCSSSALSRAQYQLYSTAMPSVTRTSQDCTPTKWLTSNVPQRKRLTTIIAVALAGTSACPLSSGVPMTTHNTAGPWLNTN